MDIQEARLTQVLNFIENGNFDLQKCGSHKENIKILMPKYFEELLKRYYTKNVYGVINIEKSTLYGCEINSHYKNEVVIFEEMANPSKSNPAHVLEI